MSIKTRPIGLIVEISLGVKKTWHSKKVNIKIHRQEVENILTTIKCSSVLS